MHLIAQLPEGLNLQTALIVYGPMGIMLMWFAMRAETKLDRVVDRIDYLAHKIQGMTTAMLADIISREGTAPKAKKIAEDMLDKISRGDDEEPDPPVKRRGRSFMG